MSSLLDGIIGRVVPPFTLSKLEGDAVFAFAFDADDIPRGDAFLGFLAAGYSGFRAHLSALEDALTCDCAACSRAAALDLKFVLHAGQVRGPDHRRRPRAGRAGRGHGPPTAQERRGAVLGHAPYALVSDAAVARLTSRSRIDADDRDLRPLPAHRGRTVPIGVVAGSAWIASAHVCRPARRCAVPAPAADGSVPPDPTMALCRAAADGSVPRGRRWLCAARPGDASPQRPNDGATRAIRTPMARGPRSSVDLRNCSDDLTEHGAEGPVSSLQLVRPPPVGIRADARAARDPATPRGPEPGTSPGT